MSTEEIIPAIK